MSADRFRRCLLNEVPPQEQNTQLFIFLCCGHGESKPSLDCMPPVSVPPPAPMSILAAAWGTSALRGGCRSCARSQPQAKVERDGEQPPPGRVSQPPDLPALCSVTAATLLPPPSGCCAGGDGVASLTSLAPPERGCVSPQKTSARLSLGVPRGTGGALGQPQGGGVSTRRVGRSWLPSPQRYGQLQRGPEEPGPPMLFSINILVVLHADTALLEGLERKLVNPRYQGSPRERGELCPPWGSALGLGHGPSPSPRHGAPGLPCPPGERPRTLRWDQGAASGGAPVQLAGGAAGCAEHPSARLLLSCSVAVALPGGARDGVAFFCKSPSCSLPSVFTAHGWEKGGGLGLTGAWQ